MKTNSVTSFLAAVGLLILGNLPAIAFASACDIPGECKGVVEEVTLPAPPPAPTTPTSATGCWIPGRTNCSMVAGSCVCDPLPPAPEEELGYLCINSDPCMNAEIIIVNGAKTCSVTKKEGCGDDGSTGPATGPTKDPNAPESTSETQQTTDTTAPKPATPLSSETPSEDTDPTKPATPVNTPPAGVPPVTVPPVAVPPVVPTDDWCDELPAAYRDCCRETKGSPIDVMKACVREETRDADCNIVINVMGDFILGDKAQMNLCCQVVNNAGTMTETEVTQECRNAFDAGDADKPDSGKTDDGSEPAASGDCADGIIVLGECQSKDFVHLQGGGDGSGCSLTPSDGGSNGGLLVIVTFSMIGFAVLRLRSPRFIPLRPLFALWVFVASVGCSGGDTHEAIVLPSDGSAASAPAEGVEIDTGDAGETIIPETPTAPVESGKSPVAGDPKPAEPVLPPPAKAPEPIVLLLAPGIPFFPVAVPRVDVRNAPTDHVVTVDTPEAVKTSEGERATFRCGEDEVVTGFEYAREEIDAGCGDGWASGCGPEIHMAALKLTCTPLTLSGTVAEKSSASVWPSGKSVAGNPDAAINSDASQTHCTAVTGVARGIVGRADGELRSFGLTCGHFHAWSDGVAILPTFNATKTCEDSGDYEYGCSPGFGGTAFEKTCDTNQAIVGVTVQFSGTRVLGIAGIQCADVVRTP